MNTMPEKTLVAFADHGSIDLAPDTDLDAVERVLADAQQAGLDLERITSELEREGGDAFCAS